MIQALPRIRAPVLVTALSKSAYLILEGGAALFRRFDIDAMDENVADLDLVDGIEFKLGLEIHM